MWAQGELGAILGQKNINNNNIEEDIAKSLTNPDEAGKFVKETNIDTFAPAVGAAHGIFRGHEKINQEKLKLIQEKTNLPLVLHGASGVSDKDIKESIKNGVRIINIDTRLRQEFTKTLRET